ncbi:MAG: hypothetical protein AB1567_06230, partial [bacterium]
GIYYGWDGGIRIYQRSVREMYKAFVMPLSSSGSHESVGKKTIPPVRLSSLMKMKLSSHTTRKIETDRNIMEIYRN